MLTSLPNLLTLSRIALIPVLLALFFVNAPWAPWAACVVFSAAAVTDYLDGWVARQRAETSAFGRLMDPIADKMLVAAALFALVAFDRVQGVSILPAIVILLREMLISGLREFLAGQNGPGLPVSRLAKWKTGVQMAAIGVLIVGPAGPSMLPVTEFGVAGLWLAAALTVATGWSYVRAGIRQIAGPQAAPAPAKAPGGVGSGAARTYG